MVESRWLRWIGPGVAVLGAVGFIASTTLGAGVRPWVPRACPGPLLARVVAATTPTTTAGVRGAPWFRLDPVLDGRDALAGQRLTFGLDGDPVARGRDLGAESFTAGPFGQVVLTGSDDGSVSRLEAVDVASGCSWSIGTDRSVIRRATIDPTGAGIYEMRVDRATRADLGVWLRPIAGGPAHQVLAAPAQDGRFGRTFSTEFTWDLAGDRLAVQSCGEAACRIRVLDPRGGPTVSVDAPDLGLLVGFDGDRVVTYGACRGLPCPIVSVDIRTGDRRVLAPAAGPAIVVPTPDGPQLVHEVALASGRGLRSVATDTGRAVDLGAIPDGFRLHVPITTNDAATRLPDGWVLLAPDGRLPADGRTSQLRLRRIPDGLTVPFDEAMR